MSWLLVPILVFMLALWLLNPQYGQILGYSVLVLWLLGVVSLYRPFAARGWQAGWSYLILLSISGIMLLVPLLLPAMLPTIPLTYIVVYIIAYQILGDVPSRWLAVFGMVGFGISYLLLEVFGARGWFPPLSDTVTLMIGVGMGCFGTGASAAVIYPVLREQQRQLRQMYQSNAELERLAALEKQQFGELETLTMEITERMVAEQAQGERLQQLVSKVQALIGTLNGAVSEIQAAAMQQLAS
ncbi:MAG: hypothetical protein MUE40_14625, partial [Anaerolineae bacterium]|nr:hypothetical protein [Anaerolineae bacterium]